MGARRATPVSCVNAPMLMSCHWMWLPVQDLPIVGRKAAKQRAVNTNESAATKPNTFAQRQLEKFGWKEYVTSLQPRRALCGLSLLPVTL